MNKKLIPYYMLFLSVILLVLNIRIPVTSYPAFETFITEAPETVALVINHVIGHQLRLDLCSDVLGYLLAAASCIMLGRRNKYFIKLLPWIAVNLGFYLCQQLMPFSLNGGMRFRAGYLLYFITSILKMLLLLRAMLHVCDDLETTENHGFNNLSIIFMLIGCFAGMVSVLIWFFDLFWISLVYLVIELLFLGIFWYRIWTNRRILIGEKTV